MDKPENLTDVDPAEFIQSLAHALRFDGRKRVRDADISMANIAAERVADALKRNGYVIKKRPPATSHSSSNYMPPRD